MLTKLTHAEYDYFDSITSENIECPIDIEYSLPDYCPDIQKILKCLAYPEISSYSFTQDKLMCEGKLVLYIQYVDGKSGTVRVCEISKEYSAMKDFMQTDERTIGRLSVGTGHIVCRAISARKLDIHIPVILTATISALKNVHTANDAEGLEKKTEIVPVSHAVHGASSLFVIEQDLDIALGCPPIESILRKSIVINCVKCLVGAQKVQVEGSVDICVIYRTFSETLSVEKMKYSLPFSQSIDVAGAEPDCLASCDICVHEFAVQPREDSMGEYTVAQLYVKLCADISLYKNKDLSIITDAYSTKNKCEIKYQNATFMRIEEQVKEHLSYKKTLFIADDELEKILDLWCEEVSVTPYCEKNKINYRGKFTLIMTYLGKSKQLFTVSKTCDFTWAREYEDLVQRKSTAAVTLNVRDYRVVDANNVEINCEGVLSSIVFYTQTKRILVSAEIFDLEKLDNSGKIVVYYSEKGEELWGIGRQYHTSVASIIENNNLAENNLSPGGALAVF